MTARLRPATTEVNIRFRARAEDRDLIDQAAELLGSNRPDFILSTVLKEAKDGLLDRRTIHLGAEAFQKVMDLMNAPPTPDEAAGIRRLLSANAPA